MDKIYRAKEIYKSVAIPPELESVVNSAIEQGRTRKAKKLSMVKTLVPVVACAAICLAVGMRNSFFRVDNSNEASKLSLSRAMPAPAADETAVFDTPYGTMVSERVILERKNGNNLELIYCDENFASFSSVTSNGETRYHTFRENSSAEDVILSDLGLSGFSENAEFYISGHNTAVIIDNGEEIEVKFGGAE